MNASPSGQFPRSFTWCGLSLRFTRLEENLLLGNFLGVHIPFVGAPGRMPVLFVNATLNESNGAPKIGGRLYRLSSLSIMKDWELS